MNRLQFQDFWGTTQRYELSLSRVRHHPSYHHVGANGPLTRLRLLSVPPCALFVHKRRYFDTLCLVKVGQLIQVQVQKIY